jgi:hypothetical protein
MHAITTACSICMVSEMPQRARPAMMIERRGQSSGHSARFDSRIESQGRGLKAKEKAPAVRPGQ